MSDSHDKIGCRRSLQLASAANYRARTKQKNRVSIHSAPRKSTGQLCESDCRMPFSTL